LSEGTGETHIIPWIQPGAQYEFQLYAGTSHATRLVGVTVTRPASAAAILQSVPSAAGAVILLYHRVAEVAADPWSLCVAPSHFGDQIELLARHFNVIPLQELIAHLANGSVPERTVVLTFDDGYADTLDAARTVLERYGLPATAFIPTGFVGDERGFWWDQLECLLLQPGTLPSSLHLVIGGERCEWTLGTAASYGAVEARSHRSWRAWNEPPTPRHALYQSLERRFRSLDHSERTVIIDELVTWAGVTTATLRTGRCLTGEELRALVRGDLIEIGAHTVTHRALARLPEAGQRAEIERSKTRLEESIGRPVRSFAYPFGSARDFTEQTADLVRKAGFSSACSNVGGLVTPSTDVMQLPRAFVEDCDAEGFAHRLVAWFHAASAIEA
jgi:peptidoglycan/xylan/chitin deacetylase (PgdA/CDA1 family)